jgi:hypothetical protein
LLKALFYKSEIFTQNQLNQDGKFKLITSTKDTFQSLVNLCKMPGGYYNNLTKHLLSNSAFLKFVFIFIKMNKDTLVSAEDQQFLGLITED